MKLQEYEPEVALAVRIPCTHSSAETEDEGEDENTDIDSMLLSYGFEYVDATRSVEGGDEVEDGTFSNSYDFNAEYNKRSRRYSNSTPRP